MRALLLLLLLLSPALAIASGGVFSVDPADKSMQYLGMIFGTVPGTPIINTDNDLFSRMIYIFNQVIFALGLILIVYTTVVGVMNTAQEGEFLGKKWHPIMVPLRAAFGTYLLLPTVSGYNWIQITVMWFIVQGVGAANALWKEVITYNQNQGSIHQLAGASTYTSASQTVNSIFTSLVCAAEINRLIASDSTVASLLDNENITQYSYNNGTQWAFGRLSHAATETPLCGYVNVPTLGSSIFAGTSTNTAIVAQNQAVFLSAIQLASNILETDATEAVLGTNTTPNANDFASAAKALQNAAAAIQPPQTLSQINQQTILNGWIHAGSYYFQIAQGNSGINNSLVLNTMGINTIQLQQLLGNSLYAQAVSRISSVATTYVTGVGNVAAQDPYLNQMVGTISLNAPNIGGSGQSVFALIFGNLFERIVHAVNDYDPSHPVTDPLIRMMNLGSNLVSITEITFWSALGAIFGVWLVTNILYCIQPVGQAFTAALGMILPIATMFITLLWAEGVTLSLYAPMIPYLVFSFSALTWMILVVEAMLGSSLIALSLVVPSEEEIGKAGHAIVILLGLFLRPALMILGFIMGIQFLIVGIGMLNFAFWSTIVANTGGASGVGVFGLISIMLIYSAIAIGMIHEAFSLIYLIPNKVLRWMGGGPEEDDAGEKAKEMKGSVDKGAGIGKQAMQKGVSKTNQKLNKKGEE